MTDELILETCVPPDIIEMDDNEKVVEHFQHQLFCKKILADDIEIKTSYWENGRIIRQEG